MHAHTNRRTRTNTLIHTDTHAQTRSYKPTPTPTRIHPLRCFVFTQGIRTGRSVSAAAIAAPAAAAAAVAGAAITGARSGAGSGGGRTQNAGFVEDGWALSRGEHRDRQGDAVLATDSTADAERRKKNSGSWNASNGMDPAPAPFGCFFSADESQTESGRKALRLQQQQHHQQQQQRQNNAGLARGGVCLLYTSPSPRD